MKKITLLLNLLIFTNVFAQSTTTGEFTLTSGFTVQFDYNDTNQEVTMTLKGPSDVWLGVGLDAQSMGYTDADVIIYSSSGLKDYHLAGNTYPDEDTNQWSLELNEVDTVSGERTIIAKRPSNTGESTDYNFTSFVGSIPVIYAKGSGPDLNDYHTEKGTRTLPFVLSTSDVIQKSFEIYPNPTINELNFEFPQNIQSANVQVYNVLGKQILQKTLKKTYPKLNTSSWASGMYVVQIVTENAVQTMRVVKQ
ncbi:MAG: T9SS type A sorting domain-containing protein [Flavobacteriaceae bacterium]